MPKTVMPDATQPIEVRIDFLQSKLQQLRFPWLIFLIVTAIFSVPIPFFSPYEQFWQDPSRGFRLFAIGLLSGSLYGAIISFTVHASRKRRLERQLNLLALEAIGKGTAQLQQDLEENFFTNLVKINFKYIDKYYLQTQVQADKSFTLSAFAALISLVIVTAGIVMLFLGRTTPGYATAGIGVLGESIATVFLPSIVGPLSAWPTTTRSWCLLRM